MSYYPRQTYEEESYGVKSWEIPTAGMLLVCDLSASELQQKNLAAHPMPSGLSQLE